MQTTTRTAALTSAAAAALSAVMSLPEDERAAVLAHALDTLPVITNETPPVPLLGAARLSAALHLTTARSPWDFSHLSTCDSLAAKVRGALNPPCPSADLVAKWTSDQAAAAVALAAKLDKGHRQASALGYGACFLMPASKSRRHNRAKQLESLDRFRARLAAAGLDLPHNGPVTFSRPPLTPAACASIPTTTCTPVPKRAPRCEDAVLLSWEQIFNSQALWINYPKRSSGATRDMSCWLQLPAIGPLAAQAIANAICDTEARDRRRAISSFKDMPPNDEPACWHVVQTLEPLWRDAPAFQIESAKELAKLATPAERRAWSVNSWTAHSTCRRQPY